MLKSNRTLLLLTAALAMPVATIAQAQHPADEPEVTLGAPPAADPLSPDRPDREAVQPRDPDGNPLVSGIMGVPATRLQVDPRVLGVAPGEPLPNLYREGAFVRNRTGRLLPAGERGYAVFVLDPDDEAGDYKPVAVVVAPSRALESMEELVKQRDEAVGFTLSGQVHTYRGVNYLMITAPPRPWLEQAEGDAQPALAEGEPDPEPQVIEDTPQEGPAVEEPDNEGPLSPEEELERLINQRDTFPDDVPLNIDPARHNPGGERLRMPDLPRGGTASNPTVLGTAPGSAAGGEPTLREEGAMIIQRTGRLVRSGDGAHAMFVFEPDGSDDPEPPMILQACKLLEEMEATLYAYGDHLPLVVTGQVQTYRGANYLLPTILRQEFDRGNLE